MQMVAVAILLLAATTLADPKLHSTYANDPTAEALDNYNEVSEESDFCQSILLKTIVQLLNIRKKKCSRTKYLKSQLRPIFLGIMNLAFTKTCCLKTNQ